LTNCHRIGLAEFDRFNIAASTRSQEFLFGALLQARRAEIRGRRPTAWKACGERARCFLRKNPFHDGRGSFGGSIEPSPHKL